MARLPEWWDKTPWDIKCGETGICLGFTDYVISRYEYGCLKEAAKQAEQETLYGGKHEQSRFSL